MSKMSKSTELAKAAAAATATNATESANAPAPTTTLSEFMLESADDIYSAIGLAGATVLMSEIKIADQDGYPVRKLELVRSVKDGVASHTIIFHAWE